MNYHSLTTIQGSRPHSASITLVLAPLQIRSVVRDRKVKQLCMPRKLTMRGAMDTALFFLWMLAAKPNRKRKRECKDVHRNCKKTTERTGSPIARADPANRILAVRVGLPKPRAMVARMESRSALVISDGTMIVTAGIDGTETESASEIEIEEMGEIPGTGEMTGTGVVGMMIHRTGMGYHSIPEKATPFRYKVHRGRAVTVGV